MEKNMQKVPKCEGCEFLEKIKDGQYYYRFCHSKAESSNEFAKEYGKGIFAKDAVTSPKWCPKRQGEKHADKV